MPCPLTAHLLLRAGPCGTCQCVLLGCGHLCWDSGAFGCVLVPSPEGVRRRRGVSDALHVPMQPSMQKAPGRGSAMPRRGEAVQNTERADHGRDRRVGSAARTWGSMAALGSSPATKICVAYDEAAGCCANTLWLLPEAPRACLAPVAGAALSRASGLAHLNEQKNGDVYTMWTCLLPVADCSVCLPRQQPLWLWTGQNFVARKLTFQPASTPVLDDSVGLRRVETADSFRELITNLGESSRTQNTVRENGPCPEVFTDIEW
jgi:hypothetical protein